MKELLGNPLILSIGSAIIGAIITFIVNKIINKTKKAFYTVNTERVALSTDDPIFGNIKVEWQGSVVHNLYNTVIELENTTSQDIKNLKITIWSGRETFLLNERTAYLDSIEIIKWSSDFKQFLQVSEGERWSQEQLDKYHHQREYSVPVFNRGQELQFIYLSTVPSNDIIPGIWIDAIHPGLKLKQRYATNKIHNVLVQDALFWGIIAAILVIVLSFIYISNIWLATSLCLIVGLMVQSIGAYIYKTLNYFRKLISE